MNQRTREWSKCRQDCLRFFKGWAKPQFSHMWQGLMPQASYRLVANQPMSQIHGKRWGRTDNQWPMLIDVLLVVSAVVLECSTHETLPCFHRPNTTQSVQSIKENTKKSSMCRWILAPQSRRAITIATGKETMAGRSRKDVPDYHRSRSRFSIRAKKFKFVPQSNPT